jgi:hypothetical protein
MGALDTAFKNAFLAAAAADTALCRALGAAIEAYLAAPYSINANAAASPTSAPTGMIARVIGKDGDAVQALVVDGFGGVPEIIPRRANSTGASPAAIANGDILGRFSFAGYHTSGGSGYSARPASLRAEATQTHTSSAQGTRLVFATTPDSSTTPADALFIGKDQSVRAKGPLGYINGQGAGSTVSQASSRTTGVTLNAATGQITLVTAAGASTGQSFVLTNSFIEATDILVISVAGSPTGLYYFGTKIGSGSATITMFNPGNNNESVVLNFAIIKGANN